MKKKINWLGSEEDFSKEEEGLHTGEGLTCIIPGMEFLFNTFVVGVLR